ncbi:MAG: hypothetical protein K2X98_05595 [Alphaproteobacteria bacterium]|nr:hypothetical protein [Alphaproteobacteria bacterium]
MRFFLFLLLCFCNCHAAFKTWESVGGPYVAEIIQKSHTIWGDKKVLEPYAAFIHDMKSTLLHNLTCSSAELFDHPNHSPKPYCHRTLGGIYLETIQTGNEKEKLVRLWTPFGEIPFLRVDVDKTKILTDMMWQIMPEEITLYALTDNGQLGFDLCYHENEKLYKIGPLNTDRDKELGHTRRLYELLQLSNKSVESSRMLFSSVCKSDHCDKHDRERFCEVYGNDHV